MQYKETSFEQICYRIITLMSVRKVCQGYGARELAWPGNSQRTHEEADMHSISGLGSRGRGRSEAARTLPLYP